MSIEKRKFARIPVNDAIVDLTFGSDLFQGCTIINISEKGLCVSDIRKRSFDRSRKRGASDCNAVVTFGENKPIRVKLVPRWFMDTNAQYTCGFEIISDEYTWMMKAPLARRVKKDDVWGSVSEKYL